VPGGLRPGLGTALKALARRSPIPVDLQMRADERLPDQVEVAGEVLRVAVRAGGADLARGTGLVGLKDRVEALGGRIFLDSRRGAGTTLRAEFPLTATNVGVTSR
jgi:glucose-6-phosphate-specific signal transduction histidine kinase